MFLSIKLIKTNWISEIHKLPNFRDIILFSYVQPSYFLNRTRMTTGGVHVLVFQCCCGCHPIISHVEVMDSPYVEKETPKLPKKVNYCCTDCMCQQQEYEHQPSQKHRVVMKRLDAPTNRRMTILRRSRSRTRSRSRSRSPKRWPCAWRNGRVFQTRFKAMVLQSAEYNLHSYMDGKCALLFMPGIQVSTSSCSRAFVQTYKSQLSFICTSEPFTVPTRKVQSTLASAVCWI